MQCTVSPFIDDLGHSDSVEICTGATAWNTENEETLILVFGQGLWFGDRMPDGSLLNPYQCRSFGISICDDPMDPHRALGMYNPTNDLHIPMTMRGSFCSLNTRCPTHEELDTCTYVILSDEHQWVGHLLFSEQKEPRIVMRIYKSLVGLYIPNVQ